MWVLKKKNIFTFNNPIPFNYEELNPIVVYGCTTIETLTIIEIIIFMLLNERANTHTRVSVWLCVVFFNVMIG